MSRINTQPATPAAKCPGVRTALCTQALAAAALALVPTSTLYAADLHFSFTYSDPITQAAGILSAHDNGNGTASAFGGTLNVTSGSLVGSYALLANPSGTAAAYSPMGRFIFDDVLFPSTPATLDVYGLLFADNVREINIWGNGGGQPYSLWSAQGGGYNYSSDSGVFTLTRTDEVEVAGSRVPGPGVPVVLAGAGMMLFSRRRR